MSFSPDTLYRTTGIFSGILGRKLRLVFDPRIRAPYTDNYVIHLPNRPDTPYVGREALYAALEHELAHLVFRTDSAALHRFAAVHFPEFLDFFLALLHVLEDERVESLWVRVYPGSQRRFNALYERIAVYPESLLDSVIAVRLGRSELIPMKYHPLVPAIEEALQMVRNRGPAATFVAGYRLMRIIAQYIRQLGPDEAYGLSQFRTFQAPLFRRLPEPPRIQRNVPVPQLVEGREDQLLEAAREEAEQEVETVRARLIEAHATLRPARPPVRRGEVRYVPLAETTRTLRPFTSIVRELTQLFSRVRGREREELAEEGVELDVEEYIEYRALRGRRRVPFFLTEAPAVGMNIVLLVDASRSMAEVGRLERAKRLAYTLALALSRIEGVRFDVLAFSGDRRGKEVVLQHPRSVHDIARIGFVRNYPFTPLHLAITEAARLLATRTGHRVLLLLTDGCPELPAVTHEQLVEWVRSAVQEARRAHVHVFAVIVNPRVDRRALVHMFGRGDAWAAVHSDAEARRVIVSYVARLVCRYLETAR